MSRLLPLVLFAGLAGCTSLNSALDSASGLLSPSSGSESASASADNGEGGEAQAQAEAAPARAPGEAAGESETAAAPAGEQAAAAPPGAAEDEDGAIGEMGLYGRRVITVPKGGGAGADVRRRLDSLFGDSRSASPAVDTGVKASEIVGTWLLEEEDGLRNCTITLTAPDKGGAVSRGGDCTGLAAEVTGWGMFGNDLLLRDADNTVRARLRQSEAGWIGFTLESGIPLVMSRAG